HHFIDGIHDAGAKEIAPHPVDCCSGEIGIVAGGNPLGQRLASALLFFPRRLRAIGEGGLEYPLGARQCELVPIGFLAGGKGKVARTLALKSRKERSETPELVLLPLRKGMMVALGTLEAEAQEQARRCRRKVFRFNLLGHVKGHGVGCALAAEYLTLS